MDLLLGMLWLLPLPLLAPHTILLLMGVMLTLVLPCLILGPADTMALLLLLLLDTMILTIAMDHGRHLMGEECRHRLGEGRLGLTSDLLHHLIKGVLLPLLIRDVSPLHSNKVVFLPLLIKDVLLPPLIIAVPLLTVPLGLEMDPPVPVLRLVTKGKEDFFD